MTAQRKGHRMNLQLAKAVIAVFQDDSAEHLRGRFAPFVNRDWVRSKVWLHTSGLALYFLARARTLGIDDVMPVWMLQELESNHTENCVRTQYLFDEFVKINVEFQRAKLSYANLKGFTLSPRSCPDPTYRYQHNLDFLVSRRDAERCRQALQRQGYQLAAIFHDTLEFRAGPTEVSSMRDLYKARAQRSLEVHLTSTQEQSESQRVGDRLSRLQLQVWNGFEFPALSECDKLLGHALHLFKHFQTEWTRTAWMLEYATAIHSHRNDESFWKETVAAIDVAPETKIGIGVASLITSRTFGIVPPAAFAACTVDEMTARVRLWVDRYQDDVVFLEIPGSKLYLLLQDVLLQDHQDWQSQRRRKLFPSRLPPRTILTAQSNDLWLRAKTMFARVCYICARLRFHVTEGIRYKIEATRWKKFVADSQV
jgi:hypothetical protein